MEKILISTSTFDVDTQQKYIDDLKQRYELVTNPYQRRCTASEMSTLLADNVTGLIAGLEPLTEDVLAGAKQLRVISRCGVGLNNVDLVAARALNIDVYNTPEAPSAAVSELTLGLILALLRKLVWNHNALQKKVWQPMMGRLLSEQTVGIIGFGRIGQKVAKLLAAFGCEILICDPFFEKQAGVSFVTLDELLARATVVSLHLPASADNRHFLNAEKLDLMRQDSILVNTARGELVDESALYERLKAEKIAGAALDVFENEPYDGLLLTLSNVISTSHIGSYARESRVRMEEEALQNLLKGLAKNANN